jgi:polysaccharide pyruvyl transferase WcaK-like protein
MCTLVIRFFFSFTSYAMVLSIIVLILLWGCSCLKDQNGKVLTMGKLVIEPPESSTYLPHGQEADEIVIRGGPHLKGFLPYHRRLAEGGPSSSSLLQCPDRVADNMGGNESMIVGTYTGWLGRDNMGDEIVSDLFFDLFLAQIITKVKSLQQPACISVVRASPDLSNQGSRGCNLENSSSCDFAVLGGGSTVYVDYSKHISGAIGAFKPIVLFGSGHQSGLRKKSTTDKYMTLLCSGRLLGGVRGSYTQAYLKRYGGSCNTTRIIRDSALLAESLYSEGRTKLRSTLKVLVEGKKHIVVATLKNSPRCLSVYNSTLRSLIDSGMYAVVLQAVDHESNEAALEFAARFNQDAPAAGGHPLIVHDEYQDWAAILDLYRHASAAFSSRLHSGVLNLAVGRPTLYYAKNSKYIDLMGSINQRSMLVNPTSFESKKQGAIDATVDELGQYLAGRIAEAIRESPGIRARLAKVQKEMLRDYERMMADLFQQLEADKPERFSSIMCCKSIRVARSAVLNARKNQVLIEIRCLDKDTGAKGDDQICLNQ